MIHTVYLPCGLGILLTKNLGRVSVASFPEPWLTVAQAGFCEATIGLNRQHKQDIAIDASATPRYLCWNVMTSAEIVPAPDPLHDTLKYHLLGPSLTKAGQDSVDQQKVAFSKHA